MKWVNRNPAIKKIPVILEMRETRPATATLVNDLLQSTESSKNCSKASEDEVLGKLSKLHESEGTVSDPINANLASLVDKMVKTSLSEEIIKEKHEKYNRPENCENLINTRVHPEIWSKVRSNTRSRDK